MQSLNLPKLFLLALGLLGVSKDAAYAASNGTLLSPLYQRLPTGSIKPSGWALNQARVQADGLAGHLADWYTYVAGSVWIGGSIEYSEMLEASPYWFNAEVALAFQLDDQRLISQVRAWLDYVLDHQQEDGWLGPDLANSTLPRLSWPRYLMLFGMIQYAEADPSQTTRIVDAMHKFIDVIYDIWKNNEEGDQSLGFQYAYQYVRWEELVYSLQWLYDFYPRGKEDQLLETMQLVKASGYDWKSFFTDANFPKEAVVYDTMQTHGVNIAEALKSEAISWRFTQDETDIQSTWERIDLLYTYHGRESGTYAADEHLAGLDPSRGTETCDVVEQMFSLETIYQLFGNNSVADRAEKLAYNALPGALTADWWGRQYDQEANQIWAMNMTGEEPFQNSGYSNVFGMEPNYPCCTVNHPQGYPKFWAHSFFTSLDNTTLIHALLGPTTFEGELGNNMVKVVVDTIYPFGSTLKYEVTASQPLTFKFRVPEYAKTGKSTISVGAANTVSLAPDSMSLQSVQISSGTTNIEVTLDMPLEVKTLSSGAVAINRGPLNYVVELPFNTTETLAWRNPQAASDARRLFPNAPAEYFTTWDNHTHDWSYHPTSEWRLAIDPNTIVIHDKSPGLTKMPYYAWAAGSPPVTMSVSACQIDWEISQGTASAPPPSPATCVGDVMNVTLAPYGAAKLRLGEIPTMTVS